MSLPGQVCTLVVFLTCDWLYNINYAGTSAAAAGSVAVAASPGPLLDQGLLLEQGPLLEQGHLEVQNPDFCFCSTVRTYVKTECICRQPKLWLRVHKWWRLQGHLCWTSPSRKDPGRVWKKIWLAYIHQAPSQLRSSFDALKFTDFILDNNSRVPVSPIALVAAAAELQESARIATRLSTASASS